MKRFLLVSAFAVFSLCGCTVENPVINSGSTPNTVQGGGTDISTSDEKTLSDLYKLNKTDKILENHTNIKTVCKSG